MQHTIEELKQMQALPLGVKIAMSKSRIREWVREFGEDGVYISFSGGKDSTVLLDIARQEYPNLKAVFLDTGLEYPEIREFVKTFDNVDWIKPSMTFKQVIEKYGYPFISKEVSNTVQGARKGWKTKIQKLEGTYRTSNGEVSTFNKQKWAFLLDAPFKISDYCCNVLKKQPAKSYEKRTKRVPIMGQLAEEGTKRKVAWLHTGCNQYETSRPQSNPMAFWTEQDVLRYIVKFKLRICSVYGEVVPVEQTRQIAFEDLGVIEDERELKTTGCERTGCVFCGYGCYLNNDKRFVNLKQTHPNLYEYIMKPTSEGGLGYKEIIDWINENGGFNIKY